MGLGPEAALTVRRIRGYGVALVAVLTLTSCGLVEDDEPQAGGSPSSTAEPSPSEPSGPDEPRTTRDGTGSASPTDAGPSYSDWELGARPLPLRPDGFGVMRPTPEELRVRRFPTVSRLPAPAGGRFESTIGPVTPQIRRRMGKTWSQRCPVDLGDLRYVTVSFRGFDGEAHTGELVIAEDEAADVVSVFRALFEADFPIEEMRLPTTADIDAHPTGDGNNTAGMVCRATRGSTTWSAHAYGLAIDVNPFQNPYQNDDVVLPELASAYLDRGWRRPGMILPGSVAVREFARIGWSWGGAWSSLKDYQHFSATGR